MKPTEGFDKEAINAAMGTSWQWVDNQADEGEGWAAEGNPLYKWAQYDTPPVPVGGGDGSVLDPMNFAEEERTPREHSEKIFLLNLPFIGRLQFVKYTPGFLQANFVVAYWIYGSWSLFTLVLLPHYREGHLSILPLLWYGLVSVLCICAFVKASTTNPGRIPIKGKREKPIPQEQLENPMDNEYCARCQQRRPRQAHHCSVCGQCVRRMDHHCPWINNCVGEENRFMFTQLVMYATLMSGTALLLLLSNSYLLPMPQALDMSKLSMRHRYDFLVLSYILSALMMLLGFGLWFSQACMMRYDMSTLDFYGMEQQWRRSGKHPWQGGAGLPLPTAKRSCRAAYNDYCGTRHLLCYFFPCRRWKSVQQPLAKPTHMV